MPGSDARLKRLSRNFAYLAASRRDGRGAMAEHAAHAGRSAAVVCWDLTHNPVGRAHVLCTLLAPRWNVELIGPIWPRFGTTLWEPLRNEGLRWHGMPVRGLEDVWCEGMAVALARRFDIVFVSKPRLPGLIVGLLLAEQSRCPLLLDFDEDEHAFAQPLPNDDEAAAAAALLREPFGAAGTTLAARHWDVADAVTVSSPLLRTRFGGRVVRHARDEAAPLARRADARQHLGFAEQDFVLAFIGTARAHKGIGRVLTAMDALQDSRVRLLVAGAVPDAALRRALQGRDDVVLRDGCDIGALGTYLAAADLVPLLQEPESAIAQSQFPAKLSDALQHGIRVVATQTPPLRELEGSGAVDFIAPDGLAAYLRDRLAQDHRASDGAAIRRFFEDEFSLAVNRARLEAAIAEAQRTSNPFTRTVSTALQSLAAATRRAQAALGSISVLARPALAGRHAPHDVAFFWKQNDSDLFGRRADMVTRHLRESGRVRRVVHFDRPVGPSDLRRMAAPRLGRAHSVQAMQFPKTAARALHLADEPGLARRLFLTADDDAAQTVGGRALAELAGFGDYVAASLAEAGCDPDRTLAWVCPIVPGFPAVSQRVRFRRIIVDLIDDERSWSSTPELRRLIEAEYEQTLRLADLVLTNCAGNEARFAPFTPDIHIVPNGAEFGPPPAGTTPPEFLARLRHPAIGYVGNLNDRIEWDIVRFLAAQRPDWDIVLIGPWDEDRVPADARALPNLTLPGPLPYDVGRLCLRSIDCAIVPHAQNAVTEAMNPLKIYNYLAAGLPVVTTPIANLEGVRDLLRIAETPEAFLAAVQAALAAPRIDPVSAGLEPRLSWHGRVARMLELVDALETPPPEPSPLPRPVRSRSRRVVMS